MGSVSGPCDRTETRKIVAEEEQRGEERRREMGERGRLGRF